MKLTRVRILDVFFSTAILLGPSVVRAQGSQQGEVVDPTVTVESNKFKITYAIKPVGRIYDVRIIMRSVDDSAYAFIPRTVAGQIGRITYPGGRVEVWWDYRRDIPTGFPGDVYFEINITEVVEEPHWKWWYYVLGGAGIAAGVLLALPRSSSTEEVSPAGLPNPPRIQP